MHNGDKVGPQSLRHNIHISSTTHIMHIRRERTLGCQHWEIGSSWERGRARGVLGFQHSKHGMSILKGSGTVYNLHDTIACTSKMAPNLDTYLSSWAFYQTCQMKRKRISLVSLCGMIRRIYSVMVAWTLSELFNRNNLILLHHLKIKEYFGKNCKKKC